MLVNIVKSPLRSNNPVCHSPIPHSFTAQLASGLFIRQLWGSDKISLLFTKLKPEGFLMICFFLSPAPWPPGMLLANWSCRRHKDSANGLSSPIGVRHQDNVTAVKEEPRWPGSGGKDLQNLPWGSQWLQIENHLGPIHKCKAFNDSLKAQSLNRMMSTGQEFGLQKNCLSTDYFSTVFDENKRSKNFPFVRLAFGIVYFLFMILKGT